MNDKLDMKSVNYTEGHIEKVAALFPNCVTETAEGLRIDFDQLKQELSDEIVEGTKERYRLDWPGKREAIVTANLPTTNTLRPVREDSVDFDTTENIYIEGDNLEVLKILQESYLNKIKMIYIDPPYNTGKDFVYRDNFSADSEEYKAENLKDDEGNRLFVNPETSGRYHSDWLTMMYPRLKLARNLLTDDGVIFISIDDNEVYNLKKILDEIFGESNFIVSLSVQLNPRGRHLDSFVARTHEYVLIYAKDASMSSTMSGIEKSGNMEKEYNLNDDRGAYRVIGLRNRNQSFNPTTRPLLYYPLYVDPIKSTVSIIKDENHYEEVEPITNEGVKTCWTWGKQKVTNENNLLTAILVNDRWQVFRKDYLYNESGKKALTLVKSLWVDKEINNDYGKRSIKNLFGKTIMDFPKSVDLIDKLIKSGNANNEDIILDFFSGSATTAHAVMQLNKEDGGNRKYIMVQLPEETDEKSEAYKAGYKNICEIGKERIRRAAASIRNEEITNYESKKAQLEKMIGKSITNYEITNYESEKAQLEKTIGKSIMNEEITDEKIANYDAVNEELSFLKGVIVDEKVEELLQEIRDSQSAIRNLDTGFRVYRLDSSNMKDIYYKPHELNQDQLDMFADNVKEDRTAEDLLTQIMLDWGLPLSLPIERKLISDKEVFAVAGNSLYACFDTEIDEEFAKAVAKEHPLRIVFKDKGFKNDTAKENVRQLLKQLSKETEMRVV